MSIDEQLYKTVMESQATDSSVNRSEWESEIIALAGKVPLWDGYDFYTCTLSYLFNHHHWGLLYDQRMISHGELFYFPS